MRVARAPYTGGLTEQARRGYAKPDLSGVSGDRDTWADQLAGWPTHALDGTQQRQVQHVALRIAAPKSLRKRRQAREQRYRERIVSAPEGNQCAACGKTQMAGGLAVTRR